MSVSTKPPVVLLIGGGWHTPTSYHKLTNALEASGLEVQVPFHPSMNGARPPTADFNTDTAHIRIAAEDLVNDGRAVTALMHSYGGQVGTNALHGLSVNERSAAGLCGGIAHLIYMTACALPEGKAMIDMVRHHGSEELMPLAFDFAADMTCVSRDAKMLLIGAEAGIADAEVNAYVSTLARWNGTCMYQPLTTQRAAWRDVPVTYVMTTRDMTIPPEYQKWMVGEVRREGVVVQTAVLETGHCPNFEAAEAVCGIVGRVVRGEMLGDTVMVEEDVKDQNEVKNAILSAVAKAL